jgi:integrase
VILGARCGLRHGEAAGLTVDRVDFLRRQLTVDRQLVTERGNTSVSEFGPLKTANSYRTVPLADSTVAVLAAHVKACGTGHDGLLVHENGQPVNASRFGHLWRQARKRAKVRPEARYHDTRHTFASVLLSNGVSVAAVAEYLGDTPAVVLNTYAHLMPADHDRARSAIEAAFAQPAEDWLRTEDRSAEAE